jgi:hypothetical protein
MKTCEIISGEKYCKAFETVPLSRNMAVQQTESVSQNIKKHLQTGITCSPKFSLQVDKSTDVSGLAQLLVFVRHSATILKKTSRKNSCSIFLSHRDVQGVIYSRQ